MKDGDLWRMVAITLANRGVGFVAISKAKSHCGAEQVRLGVISEQNMLGNQAADARATLAAEGQAPAMFEDLRRLGVRRRECLDFVHAIHKLQAT
eukprot:13879564-Alexandrium_andersonii.AAC.1